MSVPTEEDPFQDAGSETITTLNAFDDARHGLYEQLSLVAAEKKAVDQHRDDAYEKAELAAAAFAGLAKAIFDSDIHIDDKKDELTQLWRQDETERIKMLIQLTGCDCFDVTDDEDFDEMLDDVLLKAESSDDIINSIEDIYREDMTADLEVFLDHMEESREHDTPRSERSKRELVIRALGNHAVDVTKIAGGATIALWLHGRLRGTA